MTVNIRFLFYDESMKIKLRTKDRASYLSKKGGICFCNHSEQLWNAIFWKVIIENLKGKDVENIKTD